MALVDELIANFQAAQEKAREANETRYQQGLDIFDRIIERYKEGGDLLKGTEAQLERGRTKSVAQGMQALVSSGLSSTTQAAGLGKKFEEEVGAPVRLQAQDIASERLSGAEREKVGFIERREDVGPDYATIAGLAQQIGSEASPEQPQIIRTQLPEIPTPKPAAAAPAPQRIVMRSLPTTPTNRYSGLARLQAEARARNVSRPVSRKTSRASAPRVSRPVSAATQSRQRAAQSYAKLTSQRQRAGNIARAKAGL